MFTQAIYLNNLFSMYGTKLFFSIVLLTAACTVNSPRKFDHQVWGSDNYAYRAEMINDIRESHILKNKNREEVFQLLGQPNFKRNSGNVELWSYKIINNPKCGIIWTCVAQVVFDSETGISNGALIVSD